MTQNQSNNTGKPQGSITFSSYNLPALDDGLYELKVSHSFQADLNSDSPTIPTQTKYFAVLGPRYSLDPKEIAAQFPPPKTNGMYYNVLPHMVFKRSILPWERKLDESKPQTPWLVLVCCTQDEVESWQQATSNNKLLKVQTDTLTNVCNDAESKNIIFPSLSSIVLVPGESAQELVNYIDIPEPLLQLILPKEDELPLLASVRQSADQSSNGEENPKFPILMCNRLPQPREENNMLLLSLENRMDVYTQLQSAPPLTGEPTPTSTPKLYRFAVLNYWQFASVTPDLTFTQLLLDAQQNSQSTNNTFRLPLVGNTDADSFLKQGYVPLTHQTRQGNSMVSWYRGPLLPGIANASSNAPNPSTITSSDMLVNVYSEIGMFDVSYASAWNIGRNLMLENRRVSQALFEWKRACTQAMKANVPTHLPAKAATAPNIPDIVTDWFYRLALLEQVPFNYLVPETSLLPSESIQFFSVDPLWIQIAFRGAFAIGDIASADESIEDQLFGMIPQPITLSGFLLHSTAVSGWPHLLVNGFDSVPASEPNPPFESGLTPLAQHRYLLGKDTLLCLFEGKVQSIEIYLHPETIHYGVTYTAPDPKSGINMPCYIKYLRDSDGNPTQPSTTACSTQVSTNFLQNQWVRIPLRFADTGVIDIDMLSSYLSQALPIFTGTSAEFAYQMIEGVPKVRFKTTS